jgi:DNA-directed RNA polymerase beta subunit
LVLLNKYNPIENLYFQLLDARKSGLIENDASVILNNILGTLNIWTDIGRLISAFVNIKNSFTDGVPNKNFVDWINKCAVETQSFDIGIKNGFIEYLDPEMGICNTVIAPSIKDFTDNPILYTHIAFPAGVHGIIAALVPAIELNCGVRASYLTNHVKQAIGPNLRYPQLKFINEDHNVLLSPQIPIVRPISYDFLGMQSTPIGQNVIVAFMAYKYNQEDAIILNRTSVESGLLQINSLVTKSEQILSNDEEFKIPDMTTILRGNSISYTKLDPITCLPSRIGDEFYKGDTIISKVSKDSRGESDVSILNTKPDGKYPESANARPLRCIEKHKIHGEDKSFKMVCFGQYRTPIVGDKFNTEHAQKGTCGMVLNTNLIPYTSNGIRPDIIFNPPSIFKRKTYGQIYVAYISKIATLLGCPLDCTPFHSIHTDTELIEIMHKLGLDDAGLETMYDPETGRPYQARIFVGMHYWERQSHLVEQKLNIRNGGPRIPETGQPTHGLKKDGGQSVDRMGNDCCNAAGISDINRESHLNQGSKMTVAVCNKCHSMFTYYHKQRRCWVCHRCGIHSDFTIKIVPPATILLLNILNGLHVALDYFPD